MHHCAIQMDQDANKKAVIQVEARKNVLTVAVRDPPCTDKQEEDRKQVDVAEKGKTVFIKKPPRGLCFPQWTLVDIPPPLLKENIIDCLDAASLISLGSVNSHFLEQVNQEQYLSMEMAALSGLSATKLFSGWRIFRSLEMLVIPLKDFILATYQLPIHKVSR